MKDLSHLFNGEDYTKGLLTKFIVDNDRKEKLEAKKSKHPPVPKTEPKPEIPPLVEPERKVPVPVPAPVPVPVPAPVPVPVPVPAPVPVPVPVPVPKPPNKVIRQAPKPPPTRSIFTGFYGKLGERY